MTIKTTLRSRKYFIICAFVSCFAVNEAQASTSYFYTQIPNYVGFGPLTNIASSISDNGLIVVDGVIYNNGAYTVLTDPNSLFPSTTVAYGINNNGEVAGWFSDSHNHGFIYNNGTYTTIDPPGSVYTQAYGINNSGQATGFFTDNQGQHGFIYSGGTYTTFDIPGASTIVPVGINDNGQIAGWFTDNQGNHGFMYSGNTYTTFDSPGTTGSTQIFGINNSLQMTGSSNNQGFIYSNGIYTNLSNPSTQFFVNAAYGINNTGQMVVSGSPPSLGPGNFLASPVPIPPAILLFSSAFAGFLAFSRRNGKD